MIVNIGSPERKKEEDLVNYIDVTNNVENEAFLKDRSEVDFLTSFVLED